MLDYSLLGVDVSRDWIQYDGDLSLVSGADNVFQAIFNRLTCPYGDMAYFYLDYGSLIREWMGKPNSVGELDALADEVAFRVKQDPRVTDCVVECVQTPRYTFGVDINIEVTIMDTDTFEGNFLLDTTSNVLYAYDGSTTYMKLNLYRWDCPKKRLYTREVRPNGTLKIISRVMTPNDEGIPIGYVDFYWNKKVIGTVELNKGTAELNYDVPFNMGIGTHTIKARYRGLGPFASCENEIPVKVVKKLTTGTTFKYPVLYGTMGRPVNFPIYVNDVNGSKVLDGEINYSLRIGGKWMLGTELNIMDMHKHYSDPNVMFQNSSLIDEMGYNVPCGVVNYYIRNGNGILKATKTLLGDSSAGLSDTDTLFSAGVKTETNLNVPYGDFNFYLRKGQEGKRDTVTTLENHNASFGRDNVLNGQVLDDTGFPVTSGVFEWSVRCLNRCIPYRSQTEITNVDVENLNTFVAARITDEDGIPLNDGNINFDLSLLPLEFVSNDITEDNLSSDGLQAMIVDEHGAVIDTGQFITTDTEDGTVSTYVSDSDVDEDEAAEITIREVNNDG